MPPWVVRDALPADAPVLGWIHVDAWQAAYRSLVPDTYLDALDAGRRGREWLRWITEPAGGRSLVAERWEDGALLGMANVGRYRPNPDDASDELAGGGWGELRLLYVTPDAWGSGVGDDLLVASHDALATLGFPRAALWVFEANPRARGFYERHGWRADGTRLTFELGGEPLVELRYRVVLASGPPL